MTQASRSPREQNSECRFFNHFCKNATLTCPFHKSSIIDNSEWDDIHAETCAETYYVPLLVVGKAIAGPP